MTYPTIRVVLLSVYLVYRAAAAPNPALSIVSWNPMIATYQVKPTPTPAVGSTGGPVLGGPPQPAPNPSLVLPNAITEWTAMGDSYAAGIGVGTRESGLSLCFRYNGGYAPLLQNALQPKPEKFNWVACSGDTVPKILKGQFGANWGNVPSVVTINLGGNDIGFKDLVTRCIYGIIFFTRLKSCEAVIAASQKLVNDASFLEAGVSSVITKILAQAQAKKISGFKLYVLGYAQFFNEETTQCNDVRGLPSPRPLRLANPALFTVEFRKTLNQIAKDLNTGIRTAVQKAAIVSPGQVEFVPIDDLFETHRFCDRDEPNAHDADTWFITYGSDPGNTDDVNAQALAAVFPAAGSNDVNAVGPADEEEAATTLFNMPNGGSPEALEGLISLVDVFHPTAPGQAAIKDRLLGMLTSGPGKNG